MARVNGDTFRTTRGDEFVAKPAFSDTRIGYHSDYLSATGYRFFERIERSRSQSQQSYAQSLVQ